LNHIFSNQQKMNHSSQNNLLCNSPFKFLIFSLIYHKINKNSAFMIFVDLIPTFLYSLLAFIGISALYITYQYTVGVYLRVRYYKKQGGVGHYGFGSQLYKELEDDAIKHGDSYYNILKTQKENPGMKFFVRNVGKKPLVILTDPLLVKQFLLKAELYRKYDVELFEGVSSRSTLLSEGEEWKISRKSIAPKFAFDNLNSAIPVIIESTLENFDQWDKESKFNHLAVGMFHDITGEVILRHWFGTSHLKNRWQGKHTLTDLIKFFLDDYGTASSSYTFTILGHHIVNLGLQDSHRRFLNPLHAQNLFMMGRVIMGLYLHLGVKESFFSQKNSILMMEFMSPKTAFLASKFRSQRLRDTIHY